MIASIPTFVFANFNVFMLIAAIILASIHTLVAHGSASKSEVADTYINYLLFFAVGLGNLFYFTLHVLHPEIIAKIYGYTLSSFQYNVAMAHLTFGLLAFISLSASYTFRLATIAAFSIFSIGCATGHIETLLILRHYYYLDVDSIFFTDLVTPLLLIFLMWLHRKSLKE